MKPVQTRTALSMLAIPVFLAILEMLISGSLQLDRVVGGRLLSCVMPALGIVLSGLCIFLLGRGLVRIARRAVLLYLVLTMATLVARLALLVISLTEYRDADGGLRLLADSAMLWLSNVLIFALTYWVLDARLWSPTGARSARHFFFPQHVDRLAGYEDWEPGLFAYVFLAFTTSTTYGPTDMPAASTAAKLLVMTQATIALVIFTLTIARAVSLIG